MTRRVDRFGQRIERLELDDSKPPPTVTLDIDDTCNVVHGREQLSFFNAHYEEYCCLPIHVYDKATIPGVGVITATAVAATVADASVFESGRNFAACVGLTPRQSGTGGKIHLGKISKLMILKSLN